MSTPTQILRHLKMARMSRLVGRNERLIEKQDFHYAEGYLSGDYIMN
jgi:hypothetical protein